MSDKFDSYEYAGVIAPGSIAILSAAMIFPDIKAIVLGNEVSVGGLGIFVILSYVTGHLLQAAGNLIEKLFWIPFGGMPTQWVLKPTNTLLATEQHAKLFKLINKTYPKFHQDGTNASRDWISITREIYVKVRKAEQSQRIDAFNRTYGMLRGITAGLLLSIGLIAVSGSGNLIVVALLGLGLLLSLYRMYAFGVSYARELLVTFVALK